MGHASRAGQGINGHRSEPDQLATMSIGWPPASSVSARVVGIRPRRRCPPGSSCASGSANGADRRGHLPGRDCLLHADHGLWAGVAAGSEHVCARVRLGLIAVCTVLGPQSTVAWERRGVVTGTVVFCRFPGQSVGPAIFGDLQRRAGRSAAGRPSQPGRPAAAPRRPGRRGAHPARCLGRPPAAYLRSGITAATQDVYLGPALAVVGAPVGALVIVPRRFATTAGVTASVGREGPGRPNRPGRPRASAPVFSGRRNLNDRLPPIGRNSMTTSLL
jgi:hypothetical protein